MSIDARLSRLSLGLTAQERGILVLGSLKDGTPEDLSWRRSMPGNQVWQFNHLIDLMNGANIELASYITLIDQIVEKVQLREAWLVSLVLWEEQVTAIKRALRIALKQPITSSEYEARVRAVSNEWVPVAELAEVLAGEHDGWEEADYEKQEHSDELVISDAAWQRVCAEKEHELRLAVGAGKLLGRGRASTLQVQEGTFNGLYERKTVAVPDYLLEYRVLPDSEAKAAASEASRLALVYEALDWKPLLSKQDPEAPRPVDVIAGHLRRTLSECFADCWQAVRAIDLVLDEVGAEFNGEDPLRQSKRELFIETKEKLLGLGRELIFLDIEIETPEPEEEFLALIRKMVRAL